MLFKKVSLPLVGEVSAKYSDSNFQARHIRAQVKKVTKIWMKAFDCKYIFASLFSIHNTISLSCNEQVCLCGLRFERYFSLSHESFCIIKSSFWCLDSLTVR